LYASPAIVRVIKSRKMRWERHVARVGEMRNAYRSLVLRKIFGPTKQQNGLWRIKTNEELDKLVKHKNIIRFVKAQRLNWLGHIERMSEERVVKR
jgi:hypothetical protein